MNTSKTFQAAPGFCPDCGTILPQLKEKGGVSCYFCNREFSSEVFGDMKVVYSIPFNTIEAYTKNAEDKRNIKEEDEDEGPVIDRKCPKCGNETMSYATLQLRSADEGQTVFYTCTKCKFKETENS